MCTNMLTIIIMFLPEYVSDDDQYACDKGNHIDCMLTIIMFLPEYVSDDEQYEHDNDKDCICRPIC